LRLGAEGIAMLFAVREPTAVQELDGLPELVVAGLGDGDARLLLDAAAPGGLDEEVRERILAEAHGNPLALVELPRGLTPAELAGGFGLPDEPELSSRMEQTFLRRVQALPPETQRALLVAAAEAVGDAAVIAEAVGRLGVGAAGLVPAEDAGLVELGRHVRFRHPLVRSAAYRSATPTSGARRTRRSPRRPIRSATRIAESGTARMRPPVPTRAWPPNSSARPRAPRRAVASRRPPHSWSMPPSSARNQRGAARVPSRRRS
jgi:hypothetical protein